LPEVGDTIEVEGRRLTVLELDGRRIARLRVDPPPAPAEDGDDARTEPSTTG
jgi:putative hemolysin